MKKSLKFVGIVVGILVIIGMFGSKGSKDSFNQGLKDAQNANPTAVTSLTHSDLFRTNGEDYKKLLNNKYNMTLYLDEQPTADHAYFMSQNDPNGKETALIGCKMSSSDIAKLDGESAQKRIESKEYQVEVAFTEYVEDLSYRANCSLK